MCPWDENNIANSGCSCWTLLNILSEFRVLTVDIYLPADNKYVYIVVIWDSLFKAKDISNEKCVTKLHANEISALILHKYFISSHLLPNYFEYLKMTIVIILFKIQHMVVIHRAQLSDDLRDPVVNNVVINEIPTSISNRSLGNELY